MRQRVSAWTSRTKNIVVSWLICSFLFGLLTTFIYIQHTESEKADVRSMAQRVLIDFGSQLDSVDTFLRQSDSIDVTCSDTTIRRMRQFVFKHPAISEIGIVTPKGELVCNSFGVLAPPMFIEEPPKKRGLRYHGPIISEFLQVSAFVLARTRHDGYEINALLPTDWINDLLHLSKYSELDYIAIVDSGSGVPIFLQGRYSLPLGHSLFPSSQSSAFEGEFDDKSRKFMYIQPFKNVPQLSVIVSKSTRRIFTPSPIWLVVLCLMYVISWVGLVLLLNYYDQRLLSSRVLLLSAINRDELFNVYQPLVDAHSQNIVGAEVLIRWMHPLEGELGPAYFVPEAERDGTILEMSLYQIDRAISDLRPILVANSNFKVSFNVNGFLLGCPSYIKKLCEAKEVFPRLTIELTERDMLSQAKIKSVLHQLVDLGVEIAIDDFGTGYCGLQYLQSFPIDLLKIDQSFVASIGLDNLQSPVLNAVIEMAEKLGKKLIAEGVETELQAKYLKVRGVSVHQGWYYFKALRIDAFKNQLALGE
ncbi:EAL domain-containing protein [Pseudoalteromonas sp. P94(2023)]|uniref:EAL domain-containing protein n=2 Tax=Pseudoalteromonas obscura TaxID=3048491 RepID=A0ABT7EGQ3_9GAMM|nr:EAL domain-containing protein [Pseudoalteromonas sp. P94(2023)]MDK2594204.1 EAL domain-containing protein [Pseudoalteromonas sp. P94(2023)]